MPWVETVGVQKLCGAWLAYALRLGEMGKYCGAQALERTAVEMVQDDGFATEDGDRRRPHVGTSDQCNTKRDDGISMEASDEEDMRTNMDGGALTEGAVADLPSKATMGRPMDEAGSGELAFERVDGVAGAQCSGAVAGAPLAPRACALLAARAADAKKATDILVQDVSELVGVTEYFVIATAANNRQVDAIIDEIERVLRERASERPLHREQTRDGSWELLDYGSFVVHVFQPETRDYYRLEALWSDAPIVDLAAEAGLTDIEYSSRISKMLERIASAKPSSAAADS